MVDIDTEKELKELKTKKTASYDWAERYRPQTLSDVVGHPKAIEELREWAESWLEADVPKNKAVVLYGPPGTGKTTAAHALANDMKWEVVELNASDQRTAGAIKDIVGSASQMESLTGVSEKGKKIVKRLIIVDEADNIHGTADRGGEKALIDVIKKTNQPIVLIANEYYDMSKGLRGVCGKIQFKAVIGSSVIGVLRRITSIERIDCGIGVLERIAENSNGDIRSAINDLQAIAIGRTKILLEDIITGGRDNKENVFKVLQKIFKGTNITESREATIGLDENPEDFIQWIDENLPLEYTRPKDLDEGYRYLSRASLFLGRVRRRQDYSMWKYANLLMTSGITVAKSGGGRYGGYTQFQPPSIRRKLGQTKSMRGVRDSVALKIGRKCHVGMNFARSQLFTFFKLMVKKDERYATGISALLELEEDEIAFLMERSVDGAIRKIYRDAQIIIEQDKGHDIELFGGFGAGWKKPERDIKEIESKEKEETEKEEIEEEYTDDKYIEGEEGEEGEEKEKKGIDKTEKVEKGKIEKEVKKEDKSQKSIFDF